MSTSESSESKSCATPNSCGCDSKATKGAITVDELAGKLQSQSPNNESRAEGFALVNVLPEEYFRKEHIPGSINLSYENLDAIAAKFDTSKEIVLYCASETCTAGPEAAKQLRSRGFSKAVDLPAGTKGWKEAGKEVVSLN